MGSDVPRRQEGVGSLQSHTVLNVSGGLYSPVLPISTGPPREHFVQSTHGIVGHAETPAGYCEELDALHGIPAWHFCLDRISLSCCITVCRSSWRAMYLERPHLRFDGLYVSRNTYIRTGVTEWRVKNPVHLVCYYRYFRCADIARLPCAP